jgi:hypothetical protein
MAILEGEAAKQFTENLRREEERRAIRILAQRKLEALDSGKELFDYEKLKFFVDPSYYSGAENITDQIKNLEYAYYVEQTNTKKIQDFANHIIEIYKWKE